MGLYHPVTAGGLVLPGNLFLAPVAGCSDWIFRSICAEAGADFTFTELVSAESLIRAPPGGRRPDGSFHPVHELLRRGKNETPYAVQLFGADPRRMYEAAALLAPWKPDMVDINGGCPVPKVTKTGAGSALMRDPANLGRVVEAVVRASREHLGAAPVSLKIRSGWDDSSVNYAECARIAAKAGASMVSLHPRTRAQGYGGRSRWDHITDLVSRIDLPVTGSGDLYTPEDAGSMLRETGCAAVMFARGAMGNPFIFTAARSLLVTGSYTVPGPAARAGAAFRQLEILAGEIGERAACIRMRKQFCACTKGSMGAPGMAGGAVLRNALVHAESIEEYRNLFQNSNYAAAISEQE
ncbi:MAG: tRNA dihydrouridine synthase DusB [Treponema sp.]|jgi:nifR3 family TIM-barrel protein|nr:tRNA dihydrouridine synthase DusB [Treponema sp.]